MTAAAVLALIATQASGAAGDSLPAPSAPRWTLSSLTAARVSAPEKCSAHKAVKYYAGRIAYWQSKMGAPKTSTHRGSKCPQYLAQVLKIKAKLAHIQYTRWLWYHWAWQDWLPDKWARIGACETGYGKRPGNWRHHNSGYSGAFGFAHSSWRAFVGRADPKAGPYPSMAYLATPRQQYEVALAIYRMYGFSGWGCASA